MLGRGRGQGELRDGRRSCERLRGRGRGSERRDTKAKEKRWREVCRGGAGGGEEGVAGGRRRSCRRKDMKRL